MPYLDRVPHGVVELLRRMGAKIVPSGDLVSRFAARWSQRRELADHRLAAEILAEVAREHLARAVREAGRLTETALQARVIAALEGPGAGVQ